MLERTEELKQRVRETPLNERLEGCRRRIGAMCSEGRPPRMCIPVQHDDDDFYISTTLADAQQAVERLERELKGMQDIVRKAYDLQNEHADLQQQVAQLRDELEQWKSVASIRNVHALQTAQATLRREHDELQYYYKRMLVEFCQYAHEIALPGTRLPSAIDGQISFGKLKEVVNAVVEKHTTLRGLVETACQRWRAQTNAQEGISFRMAMKDLEAALPREGAITSDGGEHE